MEVTKIIKEATGLSIYDFCEKELNTAYNSFHYRLKNSSLYPSEVVYIVHRTGKSIEELFGKPWHEILISSPGYGIDDKVKDMIEKMKPQERRQLKKLLGFDDEIKKKESTPTDPKSSEAKGLSELFIETYE